MKHTKIGSAKKARRGIVGIEAAIVLIAFVVVAAALAFVALNMGFYTTQRSKEVMAAGLAQASSSLEVDGSVLAKVNTTSSSVNTTSSSKLTCIVIPIRLSAGQKPVDLTPNKTQIALWVINKEAFTNLYTKQDQAVKTPEDVNSSLNSSLSYSIGSLCNITKDKGGIAIVWAPGSNGDTVLDAGEKAVVVINFNGLRNNSNSSDNGSDIADGLDPYDIVKVEIKPPIGAALTVERTVPASLNNSVLDLG